MYLICQTLPDNMSKRPASRIMPPGETFAQRPRQEVTEEIILAISSDEETIMDPGEGPSRRRLTTTSPDTKSLPERILERLQCPVCYLPILKGQISTCSNGHIVCNTCKPQLQCCPVCRDTQYCRGLLIEQIREDLIQSTVSCNQSSRGCQWRGTFADLEKHTLNCTHQITQCPRCEWTGSIQEFLDTHAGESKEYCIPILKAGLFKTKFAFPAPEKLFRPGHKKAILIDHPLLRPFLPVLVFYRSDSGEINIWLNTLAHPQIGKTLECRIELHPVTNGSVHRQGPTDQFIFFVPAHPFYRNTLEQIDPTGNYLYLKPQHAQTLMKYRDPETNLSCIIYLQFAQWIDRNDGIKARVQIPPIQPKPPESDAPSN